MFRDRRQCTQPERLGWLGLGRMEWVRWTEWLCVCEIFETPRLPTRLEKMDSAARNRRTLLQKEFSNVGLTLPTRSQTVELYENGTSRQSARSIAFSFARLKYIKEYVYEDFSAEFNNVWRSLPHLPEGVRKRKAFLRTRAALTCPSTWPWIEADVDLDD